jgi:hypothetical protein
MQIKYITGMIMEGLVKTCGHDGLYHSAHRTLSL